MIFRFNVGDFQFSKAQCSCLRAMHVHLELPTVEEVWRGADAARLVTATAEAKAAADAARLATAAADLVF